MGWISDTGKTPGSWFNIKSSYQYRKSHCWDLISISTMGFPKLIRWHLYTESANSFLSKPGPWFNIKMPFYKYRKYHCGDKTLIRASYLQNGISYTGKIRFLYWIGVLAQDDARVCAFPDTTDMAGLHHLRLGGAVTPAPSVQQNGKTYGTKIDTNYNIAWKS